MLVLLKTNIDQYKTNCFPEDLKAVPRVGETVMVTKVFIEYFEKKQFPTTLEVVNVIHTDNGVVCELWYRAVDVRMAKQQGVNLF